MFLAHFTGSGLAQILEMSIKDVHFWFNEANKLHTKINTVKDA